MIPVIQQLFNSFFFSLECVCKRMAGLTVYLETTEHELPSLSACCSCALYHALFMLHQDNL